MILTAEKTTYQDLADIFELEDISYVISVDDCFATSYADELRQKIKIDASESPDKVILFLEKLGKDVDYLKELVELGGKVQNEILGFIYDLNDDESQKYENFDPHSKSKLNMKSDKEEIINFLETLKEENIIEGYTTLSSTHEAEKFNVETVGQTSGSILWLIDKNFENVGESSEAGLEFVKNRISVSDDNNYFFFLTKLGEELVESEIEKEFDNVLEQVGYKTPSLVYYVSKDKLLSRKYDKFAQNLAYGFNRKLYFQIVEDYCKCLRCSCEKSIPRLHEIRRAVLNYIFSQKVEARGESYFDFFARLVQIYHNDEYSESIINQRLQISKQIDHFRKLIKLIKVSGSNKEILEDLIAIRTSELYDIHINKKHGEISTGDVFKVGDNYYILATQSCDTYLREDGIRRLKSSAILLKMVHNSCEDFKYVLSCFKDRDTIIEKPAVLFRDYIFIPFEILDLCVANDDGRACIKLQDLTSNRNLDISFTPNFIKRYDIIKSILCSVHNDMQLVQTHFGVPCFGDELEKIKCAYERLSKTDTSLKKYEIKDDFLVYNVQRISRLNELDTISILNGYGVALSRVGKPFDFTEKNFKQND